MIVATAGHVDHGKTRLVQALTGVDTDTLVEEKKRGLSIDLGFAYLPLADGHSVGFIDVPGHERFMRNALCGLAAADFVLLLVAADDGPMPQTREHAAIVDLLGFQRGAVVISKIDRCGGERVEAVKRELDALLGKSPLAQWPRFALSAQSGLGVEALGSHLQQAAVELSADAQTEPRGYFRMPVDRCFEVRGAGLVVTGTVFDGTLRRNDSVSVDGSGRALRVRELRVHDREQDIARAGQRCAINLAGTGLRRESIHRGSWVCAPQVAAPVERFDAEIMLVGDCPRPLRHWAPVHLHLAAAESTARVALLQGKPIAAGESGLVQIVSDRPLGAAFGDHLIIRDQSARRTLGGGRVLDIFPPRRGRARAHRLAWLGQMRQRQPGEALRALLQISARGVDLEQFGANRNLDEASRERLLRGAGMVELDVDGRRLGFAEAVARAQQDAVVAALQRCHQARADIDGFSLDQLRAQLDIGLAQPLLRAWIERLRQQSVIDLRGAGYALASRRPRLDPEASRPWQNIEARLADNGLRPMTPDELAQATGLAPAQMKALLQRLVRDGHLVSLSAKLLLSPPGLRELHRLVLRLQESAGDGEFSVADFRDATGIGRNRCIEILESFDARGITRRGEHGRRLLPAADGAFARLQASAL